MRSSVHEPLLPSVPLPAQEGLELTHTFFRGRLCKKCRYFSNTFLASSVVSSFGFCGKKILIPASPLPSALPAHTHPHELWGLSAPLFPKPLEMRKGPKGGSLASLWLPLSPPLIVVEGSPASPPHPPPWAAVLPRALWGPDCSEPRGLGAACLWLPPASRCLVGGQSSGSPRRPPGASGQ